jgi:8-hydroxy-5-deazaflavin:NADPH oxidoreductase
MNIAVLGTGVVGTTIASKLLALGHDVKMGSRTAGNEKALAWVKQAGARASEGTFADAAAFGELAFNCTSGGGAVAALESAKAGLAGKILVDASNPLDFSKGMPPTLFVTNDDSLGERIQRALPDTKVVKTEHRQLPGDGGRGAPRGRRPRHVRMRQRRGRQGARDRDLARLVRLEERPRSG